jgi:hypothetical protein
MSHGQIRDITNVNCRDRITENYFVISRNHFLNYMNLFQVPTFV